MTTITIEQFKAHAEKILGWAEERNPIDREEYYWLVDNIMGMLINNPPKELLP